MIKYVIHLSNPICTRLVAEAFEASRKLHLENKRSWYKNITESIDYFAMDKYLFKFSAENIPRISLSYKRTGLIV
jgi:hypothetical protein